MVLHVLVKYLRQLCGDWARRLRKAMLFDLLDRLDLASRGSDECLISTKEVVGAEIFLDDVNSGCWSRFQQNQAADAGQTARRQWWRQHFAFLDDEQVRRRRLGHVSEFVQQNGIFESALVCLFHD